jgi:class 3 adenylate cyclase/predicted metal-dependent HD superfamily phosphohydrolase
MERFINILVIDEDPKVRIGLKEILSGGGNNVLLDTSVNDAMPVIRKKEIGIFLLSVEESEDGLATIRSIRESSLFKNNYIIIISKDDRPGIKLVKGMNQGAVDYLTYPFSPNLVRSKIDVYKSLFYKDQRIGQLLSNIFPKTILSELGTNSKFSPKRVEHGVVLFTDFVDFSTKAKKTKPLRLLQKLEKYFTRFDEIIEKYNLEKIKTIGDAYMALSGVTENKPKSAVRACLAAIEIREFMRKERDIAIAMKKDFWEIRIGLHMGPLVAGIIGSSKYSFDVWGDSVNIAARAEAASKRGHITITSTIQNQVSKYFDSHPRGNIEIHKRGGRIEMFYLDQLKQEYSLDPEGRSANGLLRSICDLPSMDFDRMRIHILNRLKSLLPENMTYHDLPHTLNVEKAALRYANLEGIKGNDLILLQTAVLFHDAGFIKQYEHNEEFATSMAESILPRFGYSEFQIDIVKDIILATKSNIEPKTILEEIMCDADHDYLGRPDYSSIAKKLRSELKDFGTEFSELEWIDFQLNFLENKHHYYTETAQNIRNHGKKARILDLKKRREKLLNA